MTALQPPNQRSIRRVEGRLLWIERPKAILTNVVRCDDFIVWVTSKAIKNFWELPHSLGSFDQRRDRRGRGRVGS